MAFLLTSQSFKQHHPIPVRSTFQGNSETPPLSWSDAPEGTQEFALLCEDLDAAGPKSCVHWILYGIDKEVFRLPAAIEKTPQVALPLLAYHGKNSFGLLGYMGPNPPVLHRSHRYVFKLYALKEKLDLPAGVGRTSFLKAVEGKVLAEAHLIGLYQKTIPQKTKAIAYWAVGLGLTFLLGSRLRKRVQGSHSEPQAAEEYLAKSA